MAAKKRPARRRPPANTPARGDRVAAQQAAAPVPAGGRGQQGPASTGPTARQAWGKGTGAAQAVTERKSYTARRMLTAELIAGVLIVAIRAVADYEPQADGTLKGKVGHPKGQYGPLPILAGLVVSFFLLSFLAASGGLKGKLAVIAGGVIDLSLLMKSADEFTKVADTFGTFGKAKRPPGAWMTTGTPAGDPLAGGAAAGLVPGGGGQPSPTHPKKPWHVTPGQKCPPGYTNVGGVCYPNIGKQISS